MKIAVRKNINKISPDFKDYRWIIMGLYKSGKTFTFYDMCLKLYGRVDAGAILPFEDGYRALSNMPFLTCENEDGISKPFIDTWSDLKEIVDDLIDNRFTTYKDIEILSFDTLDKFYALAEKETIRIHNLKYPAEKIGVDDINKAMKGYGKGKKIMIRLVEEMYERLRLANYGLFFMAQTKQKQQKPQGDQEGYDIVSSLLNDDQFSNVAQGIDFLLHIKVERYLEDGDTVKDFTGKTRTKKILKGENRKLLFISDGYYTAGSRFGEYLPREIPLSAENLIEAVNNALMLAGNYDKDTLDAMKLARADEKLAEAKTFVDKDKTEREAELRATLPDKITNLVPKLDVENKTIFMNKIKEHGNISSFINNVGVKEANEIITELEKTIK